MKIDIILLSSNDNSDYYTFYPLVKPIWERVLKCKCKLIYIGETLPVQLSTFKEDIIMFKPIEGIHTAFIAQNIRLLYPCLLEEFKNGILIGDVDSIPLNREYFIDQADKYSDDKFINYSFNMNVYCKHEYNMSYNLANYKVWKEIFNINSLDDINKTLIDWNNTNGKYIFDNKYRSKCVGFHFDQKILYKKLESWKEGNKDRLILFELDDNKRFNHNMLKENNFWEKVKNGDLVDNVATKPIYKNLVIINKMKKILFEKYID